MTRYSAAAIVLSTILMAATSTIGAEMTKEEMAIQEAKSWLSLIDSEGYGDSWDGAASFFKNAVSKEEWLSSMAAYRKPLGKMNERKLKEKQYMTSLPGAPDGEYVVIQFNTVFENKKEATETITPMLDADGTWRVSGYFIK